MKGESMKSAVILLSLLAVLAMSGPAFGQGGLDALMLYIDAGYSVCNYVDATPGLLQVYVVHDFTSGATASQFAVEECGLFSMQYLSWSCPHDVSLGSDARTGVAVVYDGGCQAGPVLVGTISYFTSGNAPSCAFLRVTADPGAVSGLIEGVDCSFRPTVPSAGVLTINGDGSCACGELVRPSGPGVDPPPCHLTVPVEKTSWGKVKSLYR